MTSRHNFLRKVKEYLPKKSWCIEIGVLHGDFSQNILDVLSPEHLILIDPYETGVDNYGIDMQYCPVAYSTQADHEKVLKRFEKEITSGQVAVVKKYSYEIADMIPDDAFDLVYMDASHLYSDVRRDLRDWLPKLKPNGVIAGHDYIHNESFGVIQAVDEFMIDKQMELIAFNGDGGDWAMKRQKRK